MVPVLHLPCVLCQSCLGQGSFPSRLETCVLPPARGHGGNGSRRWRRRWRAGSASPHQTSLRRGNALGARERFGVSICVASFNGLLCLRGCGWKYSHSSHLAGPASKKQVPFALLGLYIEQRFGFSGKQVSKQSGAPGTTRFN